MTGVKRSLLLSAADSYLSVVLQLAGTMIIARVLTPEEIGIFAVAAVFSGLAGMFRDLGMAEYLIQEKNLTQEKIAAAMTLNLGVSWSMAAAMFLGAPWAGGFYSNAGIADVMRVQAINFVLIPFGALSMAYFRRELNFRPMLICNAAGNFTGFGVSVSLALLGFGYMSLAWSSLVSTAVVVAGATYFRPSSLRARPGLRGLREAFDFAKFASGIFILGQLGKGAPEMVIGRMHGMVDVAMFSRANGLVELFHRLALRPVMRVCMPHFAQRDREDGSLVPAYLQSVSYFTAVGWPFVLFLGIASFSAVRIVYGPQWEAAVVLAKLLCVACALELTHILSREALLACGQARRASVLQGGLLVLQLGGLMAVVPFGLKGAAWGVVAASALGVALSQWHLHRGLGLRLSDMLLACRPSALLTTGALAPVALWNIAEDVTTDNYIRFGVIGGLATGVAWLICLRLLNHPMQKELITAIQNVRQRGRGAA